MNWRHCGRIVDSKDTMSRKSARIQGRKRKLDTSDTEDEVIQSFTKKRKADEEIEKTMEVAHRRQQFQIKNNFVPISQDSTVTTCRIVPAESPAESPASCMISPHTLNNTTPKDLLGSTFRFSNHFTTPIPMRNSPLPSFQWADSREVWHLMLRKEEKYVRNAQLLNRHPHLQPRMRAILLDWLIEVCEVYRLHRESFHLAIDFIDRYLSHAKDIHKQQLQLIGITALFIAAKLEEIYPPKLHEFAYVTDGACSETDILDLELVILKALKWDLSPLTPNSWLNVYLQLVNIENKDSEKETNFVFPQYSSHVFIQIARLLDLCVLDIGSLQFPYSVLATSALYHMSSEHVAFSVSGYQWMDIAACVQWMAPYAMTLRETGPAELKFFQHIPTETTHNIQTHNVELTLLEKAQARQKQVEKSVRSSPDMSRHPGIITPPQSTAKVQGLQSPEPCS